jgi:hypothetical protein
MHRDEMGTPIFLASIRIRLENDFAVRLTREILRGSQEFSIMAWANAPRLRLVAEKNSQK